MKITDISLQARDPNRVNVSVDGKYRLSLDILQVTELGLKIGREIDESELAAIEEESQFGILYARALEYTMMRPHSAKEVRDYLWRKTRATKYKSRKTGEIMEREGVSQTLADRVYQRLVDKGYISDESFARHWVDNRQAVKGISRRKLVDELRAKGIDQLTIDSALAQTERSDSEEIKKVIIKKRNKYPDDQKLIQYLMRQGFIYDDIRSALNEDSISG